MKEATSLDFKKSNGVTLFDSLNSGKPKEEKKPPNRIAEIINAATKDNNKKPRNIYEVFY